MEFSQLSVMLVILPEMVYYIISDFTVQWYSFCVHVLIFIFLF